MSLAVGGNPGGSYTPPPGGPGDTTATPDCDEGGGECGRQGPGIVPQCKKDDAAIDELARRAAPELSNLCASTQNEWGATIYLDGPGELRVSEPYTGCDANPNGCVAEINHEAGYGSQGISSPQIVGVMHCHPSGSLAFSDADFDYIRGTDMIGMLAYSINYTDDRLFDGRTSDQAVATLRSYVVGESAAMNESQTETNPGCENDE